MRPVKNPDELCLTEIFTYFFCRDKIELITGEIITIMHIGVKNNESSHVKVYKDEKGKIWEERFLIENFKKYITDGEDTNKNTLF